MADNDLDQQKLAYFQEITGVKDSSLSHQILDAYGWDLDSAIQAMVDKDTNAIPEYEESMRLSGGASSDARPNAVENGAGLAPASSSSPSQYPASSSIPVAGTSFADERSLFERIGDGEEFHGSSALVEGSDGTTFVWRVVTLPFALLRGSYNLIYGVFGLGFWIAGGVLNAGLGALRLNGAPVHGVAGEPGTQPNIAPVASVPSGASEASSFLREYERRYGDYHPEFQAVSFNEALRRAGQEFKFLFVYLHAPQHESTPSFCETTLRDDAVVEFINENFIAWGADVHKPEGYQMSNSLKASTFPFCAIIMGSSNQRNIAVVTQVEGRRSAGELLTLLQNVVEEQSATLIARRQEQEERDLNCRLREEQDEAYRVGLLADQVCIFFSYLRSLL
ncbi:hypothetical protein M758_4G024300 [Ceratodon purpureus]|nr:hypothetical protein M758_4G024300 [Ceratodon purpureus]